MRILKRQPTKANTSTMALSVSGRQLVADAPAAGVQHDPHPGPLVPAQLDETVPRAERAELLGRGGRTRRTWRR